jgi:hypothetical protein
VPAEIPERFSREQGCTEAEWLGWLPGAVRDRPWRRVPPEGATVDIDGGQLHLRWTPLPPRRIALIALPRMAIDYRFVGVDAATRQRFMAYFDLYMQRGGG